ncbi:hypothetical protein EMGBS3_07380 [Anaerolineaceae bacterium]|nr:hypothetical protein EMGBS3_07380 [Anaerolineaceae bacterium]
MQVRLRAAGSELQVLQSGQQLAVSQAVTVVMRPEKLALHPISGANGSGLASALQKPYLSAATHATWCGWKRASW